MKQLSFSSVERQGHKRITRREKFLGETDRVVPWSRLLAVLEPHYPVSHPITHNSKRADFTGISQADAEVGDAL